MRILHFSSSLIQGGAQRQLSYLAPALAQRGHEVHVAYCIRGPNLARLEGSGVFLHHLRHRNNYDPNILQQLLRLIVDIKPDLMQTWIVQADVLGCLAGRITGTPWLIREPASQMAYSLTWKVRLRVMMAKFASAIISNSQTGRLYWRAHLPKKPIYVIPNGLPIDEIDEVTGDEGDELGLRPDQSMVLFVGRFDQQAYGGGMVHQKNLDNLVAALVPVVREPGVVGVLCGDGPRLPVIKQLVERLGIADRVLLPGFVTNVWALMKQAKVFVSVSHFEGHPNTVLEAMVCGCPLVVSDISEHREFLDAESALLVNPLDPGEISDAILRILANPKAARRRARRAQEKARHWTIKAMVQRYEEVYREVLQQAAYKKFGPPSPLKLDRSLEDQA